ncbi:hypothetical protein GQ54DRAFT_171401 [Martensiomyces pterosporus]|nr:hypothetical protein GQ54DRAFT_171401 [Martensiomyces pterosporus]
MASTGSLPNSYVFRYFGSQGIGETIRLLLTAAKVDWVEERTEWPQEKDNQPFKHLPVLLEKNSKDDIEFILSESQVIERYIARKFGLVPSDLQLASRQEQLRDQLAEVWLIHIEYCKATGPRKEALVEKYETEARTLVEVHSRILRENGSNGHYIGDAISYIDLAAYAFFKFFRHEGSRALEKQLNLFAPDNAPEFSRLVEAVEAEPALEPYFAAERETGVRVVTLFKE